MFIVKKRDRLMESELEKEIEREEGRVRDGDREKRTDRFVEREIE